ncbi:MFS transporter [Nocardioides sp.]|uniref:MFS transporter n=1 Tax=Nocardioides sp. TaxID=35761 RepID=UPI00260537D9|nr:MFS transporter [Nocardioides sp.]
MTRGTARGVAQGTARGRVGSADGAERTSRGGTLASALVLIGILAVAGNLRAGITSVGPVLDHVRADLGLSAVAASALVSLPLVAFALVSPLAPRLARRLGFERCLALALAVLAVGLVVRSLPLAGLLWVGTALLGVAIAVMNVVLPAAVKRDFPDRIGPVTGAYSAVQSIFAALAAGVSVPLSHVGGAGWRLSLGLWAGLAVIALAVLAPRWVHREDAAVLAREAVIEAELDGDDPVLRAERFRPWRHLLAWQVTLFMGLQSVIFYVLITWLPTIETDAGISASTAGLHQMLLNGCGILGSLACSRLIPRFADQRLVATAAGGVLALAVAGIWAAPQASVVWACLAGFGGGGTIVLALSFFGLRTRDHAHAASLSGMAQCVGYLVAAAAPLAVAGLHQASGGWDLPLAVLLVLAFGVMAAGYQSGRGRTLG